MGAWIETESALQVSAFSTVAPPVGAWIETDEILDYNIENGMSLPPWERGLKLLAEHVQGCGLRSLPPWERGLKQHQK